MTEVLTREKKAAWTAWRSAYKSGTGRKILRQAGKILLGAAPGFALAFSDICGVSAGAWAAYGMAAASCALVTYPVSLGIAAAFLMRMLWGLTTRWELLIGAVLVLLSPHVLRQRNGAFPLIATGLALLPGAIIGVWQGSAATLLFGIGTILLGTLSAPVMRRAIESIRGGRSFETLESRLSVGYLLLMLLCGGARMMLPYVNLGVTAAGLMTMAAAVYLGVCPGCVMGLMAGVTLALQGLPLSVTIALSLGGFLAGMGQMTGRRMVACVLFALGTGGMLAYTGTIAWGALGAAAAAGGRRVSPPANAAVSSAARCAGGCVCRLCAPPLGKDGRRYGARCAVARGIGRKAHAAVVGRASVRLLPGAGSVRVHEHRIGTEPRRIHLEGARGVGRGVGTAA